ncbi:7403_t:CDS:2 [Rhizophagus irregularis]|nr:7403_t:CDS:2 [Rhizophagus irregularis]
MNLRGRKLWKLNHGLFLDGYRIQPSKQAVLAYDGDLDISLYKGDPVVYININDPDSPKNLLCLNNDNNYLNDALKQLDMYDDIQVIFSKVSNNEPNKYLQQYNKQLNISKQLNLSKRLNISKLIDISKIIQEKDE